MSFIINYNEIVQAQLQGCQLPCENHYIANKIDEVLDKYVQDLPVVFIVDMPELDNLYAEIINHEYFDGICLKCCWIIVQFYPLKSEENPTNLLAKFCTKHQKSLCSN